MNSYKYTISPEQLDRRGLATIPSLYKLVIDSIGLNIRKEGFGIDVMADHGLTWALARCAIEFSARPTLYDDISVEVWSGEKQGLCYGRCIRVVDGSNKEICRGITDWCVLDKSSRRPQSLFRTSEQSSDSNPCEAPKRIRPFTSQVKQTRSVGYSECDFNGHMNNSRYVEMFYDMLPPSSIDSMKEIRLDINFRREIPCGSVAESFITENPEDGYDYCMYLDGAPACCASITSTEDLNQKKYRKDI